MLKTATDPSAALRRSRCRTRPSCSPTSPASRHIRRSTATLVRPSWRGACGSVSRQSSGEDAHVVKTLGDGVMVRIADPAEAAAAGLRIVARALPAGATRRCGWAFTAARRSSPMAISIGAAVNVAARVAALAGPGEVLLTAAVAVAARGQRSVGSKRCGERKLRNVASPVLLYAARERVRRSGGRAAGISDLPLRPPRRGSARNAAGREAVDVRR